jgi:hypothetical protein
MEFLDRSSIIIEESISKYSDKAKYKINARKIFKGKLVNDSATKFTPAKKSAKVFIFSILKYFNVEVTE